MKCVFDEPVKTIKELATRKTYTITLPRDEAEILEARCKKMAVSTETYITNLAMSSNPLERGFRMLTKHGCLIDSKGLTISEYMDKVLKEDLP